MICNDQFCCCLLSDSRDSRNIISRIPHQSFDIDQFFWRYLIFFFHIVRIIIFYDRSRHLRLRNPDLYVIGRKLKQITVTGNNTHFISGFFCSSGKRSQYIIRFISFLCNNRNIHCMQDFFHQGNLFMQFRRHRFSRPFILFKHLMPKCRCFQIKSNQQMRCRFLL